MIKSGVCLDVSVCVTRGYDDVYDETCGFWLGLGLVGGSGVAYRMGLTYFLGTVLETFAASLCLAGLASSSSSPSPPPGLHLLLLHFPVLVCTVSCSLPFAVLVSPPVYSHSIFSKAKLGSRLFGASWSEWCQDSQDARGWLDLRIDDASQCRPVKGQQRETRQPMGSSIRELWDRRLHERYLKRLCVFSGAGSWADYDDTMLDIPTACTESRLIGREEQEARGGLAHPHRRRARRARSLCFFLATQLTLETNEIWCYVGFGYTETLRANRKFLNLPVWVLCELYVKTGPSLMVPRGKEILETSRSGIR